ncbi:5786_t:CDS:2, partial [Dentiscutata heterogama]
HGYDNVMINRTIPSINATLNLSVAFLNITFNRFIRLSLSTGNITIYKASDNSIRQRVSATMHDFCKISVYDLESTISIKVINSTFNEYGEQYFVILDNNFVNDEIDNEPLRGIHDGIWILKTHKAIIGSVRLTTEASKKFSNFSKHDQSTYIDNLLNELADKVPIDRSSLRSDNRFHNVLYDQIVILIHIYIENNEIKKTASEVFSDLNTMIIYKSITTFSLGVTNELDQDYGFQPRCKEYME